MKATISCLGALLVALACSSAAQAGHLFCHGCHNHQQAPNAFTPAFNGNDSYGPTFGSNYGGQLPPLPFNGISPSGARTNVCYYQFMRGPRDFFMIDP
jgi:hypothetical protein